MLYNLRTTQVFKMRTMCMTGVLKNVVRHTTSTSIGVCSGQVPLGECWEGRGHAYYYKCWQKVHLKDDFLFSAQVWYSVFAP